MKEKTKKELNEKWKEKRKDRSGMLLEKLGEDEKNYTHISERNSWLGIEEQLAMYQKLLFNMNEETHKQNEMWFRLAQDFVADFHELKELLKKEFSE